MADALSTFDITVTDIFYIIGVALCYGSRSLCKGILNSLHLRQRHRCFTCRLDRQARLEAQAKHEAKALAVCENSATGTWV